MRMARIISSFLLSVFIFSAMSSVSAVENEPQLVLSPDAQALIENSTFKNSSEFSGVLEDQYGTYALAYENTYMPVGRLDVNLTDETALTALLARDDIYPEVKDNIRRVAQNAIATGNIDANVTIFSPTFIESSYNNARGSSMTINGKYQNTPMQSIRTHYTNISTETFNLSNGKAVVNYAKGFVNLLISGAGLKNSTISLFGMGVSAYQSALDYYNATNISGSDHDFCEAHVRYDCTMQWTYALLGEQKYLGLVSQKSTLNYVYYRQYFYNAARFNGDEEIIEEYPNKPYSTEHFDDPWEIAYRYYGGPRDESGITVDIGGKKIHLDPP